MISVIMPVTLQDYPGAAKQRDQRFIQAVRSFIAQMDITDHELIIVSDGCLYSREIYEQRFAAIPNIHFIAMPKQPLFSGILRQKGIASSINEWICYLDSDDKLGPLHLASIARNIKTRPADWLYWDEYLETNDGPGIKQVNIAHGSIGTSSIAHKRELPVSWEGCNGYGHDWQFISQLNIYKSVKISQAWYYICHVPGIFEKKLKTDL